MSQESHEKLRRDNSLIEQLDCDLFGFVGTHEKLEAVNNYSQKLLKQLNKAKEENIRLISELESVKEERSGQMAKSMGEMDKKEDLQKENQKLVEENRKLKVEEKSAST